MRDFIKAALLVALWAALAVAAIPIHKARAQTAQEQIERTLGSLVVQNATCGAQTMTLQNELQRVKAELEALKAVKPDEAK